MMPLRVDIEQAGYLAPAAMLPQRHAAAVFGKPLLMLLPPLFRADYDAAAITPFILIIRHSAMPARRYIFLRYA